VPVHPPHHSRSPAFKAKLLSHSKGKEPTKLSHHATSP
jgi:hypothetical protein